MRYTGKNDPQESTYEQTKWVVSCHRVRRGGINVLRFNDLSAPAYLLHDTLDLHYQIGRDDLWEILLEEGSVRCEEVGADTWARGGLYIT